MIAFKGFNKKLECSMGRGIYRYQVGGFYEEDKARCANTGFHCVEEPIEVLRWYRNGRFCIVDAGGDVHEDGEGRISCTQLEVKREVTLQEIGLLECKWMVSHPQRKYSSLIHRESYEGKAGDDVIVVRGKRPVATGKLGTTLYLVQEYARNKKIKQIAVYQIDGKDALPDVWYGADGGL